MKIGSWVLILKVLDQESGFDNHSLSQLKGFVLGFKIFLVGKGTEFTFTFSFHDGYQSLVDNQLLGGWRAGNSLKVARARRDHNHLICSFQRTKSVNFPNTKR